MKENTVLLVFLHSSVTEHYILSTYSHFFFAFFFKRNKPFLFVDFKNVTKSKQTYFFKNIITNKNKYFQHYRFFFFSFLKAKSDTSSILKTQLRVVTGCATNILSSIAIIFLNKYIFTKCEIKTMTLTAIHMIITSLGLVLCLKMKTFVRKKVSIDKVLPLSIAYCAFVVFTNLSLEYNTIGTYQLFKVLTTPVVALISWQYYGTKYSRMVILTLVPVVIGVCTHSVNDIKLTLLGTIIASIGVLSASLYQVWVGERLKELEMNSQQLLFYQAPLSAIILIPFIFFMESLPTYATSEEQKAALTAVLGSGVVAFAVNLSVYWVIKNT